MVTSLSVSIWITIIGMTLVFSVILCLWGLIALVVRITQKLPDERGAADQQIKHQAAAAAVACALAYDELESPHEFPMPPTALVSAWQAVMRAKNLSQWNRTK